MTEKELFSKKTFTDLFALSEIDRIAREDELFLEAKNKGCEKRFKETLKKYSKLFDKKISIGDSQKLPKCKYNLDNFNFGSYICSINGIIDKSNFKFSYVPVLPIEMYINRDTGKEKIKIIFYKENEWHELIVDKTQLTINSKLLLLADFGLDVTSENVRFYIKYFNEILNINNIIKISSVSHLGWAENNFIPYNNAEIFDGGNEFRNIFNAINQKGSELLWLETILQLRKHKIVKLLMAITFSSPLLEKLNVSPYIANLWSSLSGNGKTLTCMIAMSIWGNPATGALTLSSNNTHNFYMKYASFMRNLTCYFDELQIIKGSKDINLNNLIMDLCNGAERGRLDKNSDVKNVQVWYGNFLFTNNDRLVKDNAGEQIHNRVIDIEIAEQIINEGNKIADIIKNNYGFAGKKFIEYIKKIGWEKIKQLFDSFMQEILEKTEATTKKAALFASILTADYLANKAIFHDSLLSIEDIAEYIENKNEVRTSVLAKDYIISIINTNRNKFGENVFGEFWGKSVKDWQDDKEFYKYYIDKQILTRELTKGGFDFNTVKKEWANESFLIKNSQNRYIHQTYINNIKGNYIVLLIE